ncbi:GGDEF domain-containing protein [Roseomonas sp. E05]|uniref:GGDEF domain-containing protein n=1 Tax=Roseomonas sp. E05 TaxID=3046310 RepID=UPI0024BBA326|nr:GGDEF domain-containing protein [Roseomonas sp. E05]MDJ0389383.1 GGDEF domain-containing protein [Roseomonas sp. E05]
MPHETISPPEPAEAFLARAAALLQSALQPIVEVSTGRVHGYEALMRGHAQMGFASPAALLAAAAAADCLDGLEALVQQQAFAAFRTATGGRLDTLLFLNLDPRLLPRLDPAELLRRLSAFGIPASALCVEVSEHQHDAEEPATGVALAALRGAGCRLALDDFGLGAARLSLLAEGRADYIKIDRFFIAGLPDDPRRQLILSGLAAMARRLGLTVVAEGVETSAEYLACLAAGCDLVQGYFVARPTTSIAALPPAYPHLAEIRPPRYIRNEDRAQENAQLLAAAERLPAVQEDLTAEVLFARFWAEPELDVCPVLAADGTPQGLVHERTLRAYGYSLFGRALLRNRSLRYTARHFAQACPVVEADAGADRVLEAFAAAPNAAGVILTRSGRYLAVLSAKALLPVLHERRLRQARDQSPLTGLPGNLSIAARIETLALAATVPRYLCYFDLNNFKAFNDRYGFRRGDRAIELLAEHLRRSFPEGQAFLGHIGGDDFFAGLEGLAGGALRRRLACMMSGFADAATALHDGADREAGRISGHDRSGLARNFPLLRCSAAVLELPPRAFDADPDLLAAEVAALKAVAKADPDCLAWGVSSLARAEAG